MVGSLFAVCLRQAQTDIRSTPFHIKSTSAYRQLVL